MQRRVVYLYTDHPWNLAVWPGDPVLLNLPETRIEASSGRCAPLRTDRAVRPALSHGDEDQKRAPAFALLLP